MKHTPESLRRAIIRAQIAKDKDRVRRLNRLLSAITKGKRA